MIYVGVGSDKDEKLKAYQFENSLFCKNQPHCAPKEMTFMDFAIAVSITEYHVWPNNCSTDIQY